MVKINMMCVVFVVLFVFGGSVYAQDSDLSVTIGTEIYSKYLGRGELPTDGPVVQPSITFENKWFTVNVWGSMDLDDVNENKNIKCIITAPKL